MYEAANDEAGSFVAQLLWLGQLTSCRQPKALSMRNADSIYAGAD